MTTRLHLEPPPQEMTSVPKEMSTDRRFLGRLRRLVVVSSAMLGLIALLAALSTEAPPLVLGLLASGWILMPVLLFTSISRPRIRYLLALPATLVALGLVFVALDFQGDPIALVGWWLITAGVLFGGGLGTWFWYRWMPVPQALDDPFSPGRIALIAVHIALVVVGVALVIAT